ncbi:MAG: Uncharacterised protein [Flavobacteriia bacterium]|nr:MAG: Uncharacterised protein [Flavobacteriia bacterium]
MSFIGQAVAKMGDEYKAPLSCGVSMGAVVSRGNLYPTALDRLSAR